MMTTLTSSRPPGSAEQTGSTAVLVGRHVPRMLAVARFASLLYLLVVVLLVLTALVPAVVASWQPLAVVTGSMQPAIRPGSMVLAAPAGPGAYYSTPSVVTFHDPARPGRLVTHRILDTTVGTTGGVSYTTKGDANRVADSDQVPHGDVVGVVRMVVPFVGLPALWAHNGNLAALAGFGACSLLAVGALAGRGRR